MLRRLAATLAAISLMLAVTAVAGARSSDSMAPVKVFKDAKLGNVLTTPTGHAIYTWTKEKDHKIHCTASCAKLWPPVIIKGTAKVPAHVAGVMGTFSIVMRPDGSHQLALDKAPLYTYSGEGAHQVKCNNVNGWFAVKAH